MSSKWVQNEFKRVPNELKMNTNIKMELSNSVEAKVETLELCAHGDFCPEWRNLQYIKNSYNLTETPFPILLGGALLLIHERKWLLWVKESYGLKLNFQGMNKL